MLLDNYDMIRTHVRKNKMQKNPNKYDRLTC